MLFQWKSDLTFKKRSGSFLLTGILLLPFTLLAWIKSNRWVGNSELLIAFEIITVSAAVVIIGTFPLAKFFIGDSSYKSGEPPPLWWVIADGFIVTLLVIACVGASYISYIMTAMQWSRANQTVSIGDVIAGLKFGFPIFLEIGPAWLFVIGPSWLMPPFVYSAIYFFSCLEDQETK